MVLAEYTAGDWILALVTAVFVCIPLAISFWALLDAAHRPEWAWALCGRRRVVWLTLVFVGMLSVVGGLVISAWYLVGIRPRIRDAEEGKLSA